VIMHRPGIDQISVANLLGLDRSTTGMVLKKLEGDGLVVRSIGNHDRRRHSLRLTRSGEKLLSQLAGPARRAQARVLSAFTPREQTLFLRLLDKFTREFNESTRVPLDPYRSRQKPAPGTPRSGLVWTHGTPSADHLYWARVQAWYVKFGRILAGFHRGAKYMGSDLDSSLKTSLTGVANLVDHANKLAKRSVQAAEAGNPENAMDVALEVELLLDEAVRKLNVAFAISKQGQEGLDSRGVRN
jgi:DNA-binding MarR family transcriptional regulator